MMTNQEMTAAAAILDMAMENPGKEYPEGWFRLLCLGEDASEVVFDVAVDYLVTVGLVRSTIKSIPGGFVSCLVLA